MTDKIYPVDLSAKLNVRSGPSLSYPVVDQIGRDGMAVDGILATSGNWTRYDIGWLRNDVHRYVEEPEVPLPTNPQRGVLVPRQANTTVNLREEATVKSPVRGYLPPEGKITGSQIVRQADPFYGWSLYPEGWVRNDVHDFYSLEREANWDVRFFNQVGPTANRYGGDCGAASALSIADWYERERGGKPVQGWTVDSVARDLLKLGTTVTISYRGADGKYYTSSYIKKVASLYDVQHALWKLTGHPNVEIVDDAGPAAQYVLIAPYVQLFDYEMQPNRMDLIYKGGHFGPVYGRTFTSVLYHDPVNRPFQTMTLNGWGKLVAYSKWNRPNQGVVLL